MIHDAKSVPVTHAEAEKLSPYLLARLWGDRVRLPNAIDPDLAQQHGLEPRTTDHDLEELATMAALRTWLERWTATQVHACFRNGATVDQVAAATGKEPAEVIALWREWAAGQSNLWKTFPDLAKATEHFHINEILIAWEEAH